VPLAVLPGAFAHPVALFAIDTEQRRPLLEEAAALAIDKT
jgi:hypothetical protein